MNLAERLEAHGDSLVDSATDALVRARMTHYEDAGPEETRARVAALFAAVVRSLREDSPVAVVQHADQVAHQRYHAGVALQELQVAFNTLEEAIWRFLTGDPVDRDPASDLAADLGRVGAVLGAGKDQLALGYVALVSHHRAPAVDVAALSEADISGAG